MNKIPLLLWLWLWLSVNVVTAQKYKSNNGYVKFFSEATLEDIAAETNEGLSIIDWNTHRVVFTIPINTFQFDKSLMQEHFNEKYMESEKYPKGSFEGEIIDLRDGNGKQKVKAKGKLTIHGVSRTVNVDGEIDRNGDQVLLTSKFMVRLEDHKIKIPKLLWQNIAEEVEVSISFKYKMFSE